MPAGGNNTARRQFDKQGVNIMSKKRKKTKFNWRRALPVYIMLMPAVAYLIINNYIPMYGITIAFRKLDYKLGILKSPFNGLENFKFLFASGNLGPILRNTILYNIAFMVGTVFPITVAILFNEIRCKLAKKFYQTTILMPYLMSMVIVSYLVFAFLSSDTGFINKSILEPLFHKSIPFYQEKKYWPFILVFVNQWKGIGFSMVLYLSALSSISPEYYEAAKIDGATKWQQIRHITLPSLKTMVITMTILNIAKICTSDFGLFYQIPKNSGPLYSVTQTIDTYVYNALMNQNNISMSSAASVFQALVGFILVLLSNFIIRKINPDDAMF